MLLKTIIRHFIFIFFINLSFFAIAKTIINDKDKSEDSDIQLREDIQEKEEIPKTIDKIIPSYDNTIQTIEENLEPIKKEKYYYEPFLKTINLHLNLSSFYEYGLNLMLKNIDYANPYGGINFLFKKGIYTTLGIGYSYIDENFKPYNEETNEINYLINGIFWDIGIGLIKNYIGNTYLGFIIKYGGTIYKVNVSKKDYKTIFDAHWLKMTINSKYKIFKNFNLYLGSDIGLKLLLKNTEFNSKIDKYLIPGYGYNKNKIGFTFSLFIEYSIPLSLNTVSIE